MNLEKEQRYLEGLRSGNQLIIKEIYEQFSRQVRLMVEKNSGDANDAKDVFQDGMIAMYDLANKSGFELTCPFGALLYRVCRNKWIDKIRTKDKRSEVRLSDELRYNGEVSKDAMTLAEEAEEENSLNNKRQMAFLKLSELCQQLLNLIKKGTKAKDIVAQLKMNGVNTYYRRKNACMERWRVLVVD